VWVVAATDGGRVRPPSIEMLTPAREIASALDGPVVAVLFAPSPEGAGAELARHGADIVLHVDGPGLAASEARAEALARLIGERSPSVVLGPSLGEIRDVLPRVCARLGLGMTADCIGFELDGTTLVQHKPAFGSTYVAPIVSRTTPAVATARPGVFAPPAPTPARRHEVVHVDLDGLPSSTETLERRIELEPEATLLDEAAAVIGVGIGLGGPENLPVVERLAKTLGAAIGASRRAVDQGWLPRQLQIGLTGHMLAPRLYIAIGIRGSVNHIVGMHRADTVIAINTDREADIFQHATYAVVADWSEVVPRLIDRLEALR
jgi:electron transfer flavoprotein alpha subunit